MINSQLFPNADEAVGRTNTAQGHAGKSYPGKYPVSAQNQAMNNKLSTCCLVRSPGPVRSTFQILFDFHLVGVIWTGRWVGERKERISEVTL